MVIAIKDCIYTFKSLLLRNKLIAGIFYNLPGFGSVCTLHYINMGGRDALFPSYLLEIKWLGFFTFAYDEDTIMRRSFTFLSCETSSLAFSGVIISCHYATPAQVYWLK